MKRILFVATQYRVGERIYPIIPQLASKYNLDVMKLYQMNSSHEWPGDSDLRKYFDKDYLHHFDNIYNSIDIDYSKYDLIITDDNRPHNGLSEIYRRRKCLLLACSHGVTEHGYEVSGKDTTFDGCFVFGNKEVTADYQIPAGIPANDKLHEYRDIEKKHILVIVNYLGNSGNVSTGNGTFFKLFDKDVFDGIDLPSLQSQSGYPVVIKMKSRPNTNIQKDTDYLHSILPTELEYSVVYDVENDNKLIGESVEVFSAPSTLALKPIQLQIPTTLIPGTGQSGAVFDDYDTNENYIEDTIQGGLTFNSTEYFINYVEQCLNG